MSPNKTYNLLELVKGVRERLGITELETGHYRQRRLIILDNPDDTINQSHGITSDYFSSILWHNSCDTLSMMQCSYIGVTVSPGEDTNVSSRQGGILFLRASREMAAEGVNPLSKGRSHE